MIINQFSEPKVFQEKISSFLVRHEAENNLTLGILNGLIAGEYSDHKPYMGFVEEGGEPLIAAICTPPHPAIISYQDPSPEQRAVELQLEDLMDFLGEDFKGISGDKVLLEGMKKAWETLSGKTAQLKMSMRIYKLEIVEPPPDVPGHARPAKKEDRESMLDFYAGFIQDAVGDDPDPDRISKQVEAYLTADPAIRGLWFWETDRELVSMAGYAGPTPNGIRIGAVYTPPEQRKNGYASAVTAAVSQYLLDRGYQFCFLFTDLQNPTSNHIYQQIGYSPVCDVNRFDFD